MCDKPKRIILGVFIRIKIRSRRLQSIGVVLKALEWIVILRGGGGVQLV